MGFRSPQLERETRPKVLKKPVTKPSKSNMRGATVKPNKLKGDPLIYSYQEATKTQRRKTKNFYQTSDQDKLDVS